MFCNFYLVKNNKIVNNSTITGAGAKLSLDLESLGFDKTSHIFLVTTKLFAKYPH